MPCVHARVQVNLGHMYAQGLTVPANMSTALQWYKRAQAQYPDEVTELVAYAEAVLAGDAGNAM